MNSSLIGKSDLETGRLLGPVLAEGLGMGILCIDSHFNVVFWNGWLEKHSGIRRQEIIGQSLVQRFPEIRHRDKEKYLKNCVEKSMPAVMSAFIHKFLIPLEIYKAGDVHQMQQTVKLYPIKTGDPTRNALIIIEDKTEAILHEKAINKLTRLLKGLRVINQLIVQTRSRQHLFEQVCRILTMEMGFSCAWIGTVSNADSMLTPIASDGIALNQLQQFPFGLDIMSDTLPVLMRRPAGSLREPGNTFPGPDDTAWDPFARITGSRSMCCLPVRQDGVHSHSIVVCTDQTDFFDDDVQSLLMEISADVSFGLKVLHDRSVRRNLQCQLENEKQTLEVTLRSIGDGMITTDVSGRVTMMNQVAETLTGWQKEDALGRPLESVFHIINESTRDRCDDMVTRVLSAKRVVGLANHTLLVARDGREFPIHDSGAPIITQDNEIIGVILVFQDATERRNALRAIEESEKKYRSLVEYSTDHIFMLSLEGVYLASNGRIPPFKTVSTGCDIVGRSYEALFPPEIADIYRDKFGQVTAEKRTVSFEFDMPGPDGPIFIYHTLYPILQGSELTAVGGICRNITEKKTAELEKEAFHAERMSLEKKLQQSRKMEAVGTLAGGIAHDFNNILTSIIGFTDICLSETVKGSTMQEDLQEILQGANRARDLVKQILAFSRQETQETAPVQMQLIIKETLKLLRSSLPSDIRIQERLETSSLVVANPTQIHQIVMNLFSNAAYSIEKTGGTIDITLRDVTLFPTKNDPFFALPPGDYIQMTISDTGTGIAEKHLNTIFDPYFTTKPQGDGTGLGLSIVHGIVKSLQGDITVRSEPGKGTTFTLYFPILQDDISDAHTEDPSPAVTQGQERIMLVDDEPTICKMNKRIFENIGYAVEAFNCSREALDNFNQRPNDFDLLITDMTMPEMTGETLAVEIMKIRPGFPVILCTGFSSRITKERSTELGIKAFVMKPFDTKLLTQTVRNVLDGQTP